MKDHEIVLSYENLKALLDGALASGQTQSEKVTTRHGESVKLTVHAPQAAPPAGDTNGGDPNA